MTTIHEENLKVFSTNTSEGWWSELGPVKGLHTFNRIRVPYVVDALKLQQDPVTNLKVLDVGCGGGILSEALAKEGLNVTGLDASDELIQIAKQHSLNNTSLQNKPEYKSTTIEEHAKLYSNYYDGIIASEVIEHVNNKELFVKSCVETLKPGGRILFTAPSKSRLSQFVNIFLAENFAGRAKGTHKYDLFISHEELKSMLEKYNCEVEQIQGFYHNLYTGQWHWTSYPILFFALQAVKRS